MKVAQINTYTYGGAAIAARRIHLGLLELKVDSLLLTKYGQPGNIHQHRYTEKGALRDFVLKNRILGSMARRMLSWKTYVNRTRGPKGFEKFSRLYLSSDTRAFDILNDCDIIHLHWVNDFINYEAFFNRFSTKKFVWTLHDMNPLTGGCHHSDGCIKFETSCHRCPQLKGTDDEDYAFRAQEVKIAALSHVKDDQLIIVSPSSWLEELSKKSRITQRFKHVRIPNPSFEPTVLAEEKNFVRRELGLPVEKKIILFVSDNLKNPRKGISVLFDAIRMIPEKKNILLVGIGLPPRKPADLDIVYTGHLSNVVLLSKYFYCVDIFVTPSVAENSPLVVIEALTCGTPVVASRVGGIPDLINDSNGILFQVGNVMGLANAITRSLFELRFDSEKIRLNARALHDPMAIAGKYRTLYEAISN